MKQNKTYLHLGVTLIVSACAVLMFYDTFFQSRVLQIGRASCRERV